MTQAVNCPGCHQQIVIDDSTQVQENNTLRQEVEELKKVTKMPNHIPNYQCKDSTCGQSHKNSRYNKAPKGKCRNCDQFNSTSEGVCPWCKGDDFDEVTEDDLTDLNIRLPAEY